MDITPPSNPSIVGRSREGRASSSPSSSTTASTGSSASYSINNGSRRGAEFRRMVRRAISGQHQSHRLSENNEHVGLTLDNSTTSTGGILWTVTALDQTTLVNSHQVNSSMTDDEVDTASNSDMLDINDTEDDGLHQHDRIVELMQNAARDLGIGVSQDQPINDFQPATVTLVVQQQPTQQRATRVRIRPTNLGPGSISSRRGNSAIGTSTSTTNASSSMSPGTAIASSFRQLTFGPDGQLSSTTTGVSTNSSIPVHPQQQYSTYVSRPQNPALRNKIVYRLACAACSLPVTHRSMKAILLADTKVELFSTDIPPPPTSTRLLEEDRQTQGCACRIRDTVCGRCGCLLGYHVSQPCERCLDARNNGHFWMFYSESVMSEERRVSASIADNTNTGHVSTSSHIVSSAAASNFLYWSQLTPMVDEQQLIGRGTMQKSPSEIECRR